MKDDGSALPAHLRPPNEVGKQSAASASLRGGAIVFPGSRLIARGFGALGAGHSVDLCLLVLLSLGGGSRKLKLNNTEFLCPDFVR